MEGEASKKLMVWGGAVFLLVYIFVVLGSTHTLEIVSFPLSDVSGVLVGVVLLAGLIAFSIGTVNNFSKQGFLAKTIFVILLTIGLLLVAWGLLFVIAFLIGGFPFL